MNSDRIDELIAQARIPAYDIARSDLYELVRVIASDCLNICETIAAESDATAKGGLVSEAGKTLYQGMWGGATNCGARIQHEYGV